MDTNTCDWSWHNHVSITRKDQGYMKQLVANNIQKLADKRSTFKEKHQARTSWMEHS
jgi:hypothetical protein